jgi:hypothetical protein
MVDEPPAPVEPVVPAVPLPVVPAVPLPVLPPAPLVPAVPVPLPVVPAVPVVLTVTQALLVQVWPAVQAWPQLPQLPLLLVGSTQVPPQASWPTTEQVQVPLMQVVPPEQTVPQAPQLRGSVIVLVQPPFPQTIVPVAQVDEQALLLQTCGLLQVVPQVPQFVLFEDTQLPPHFKRPVPQAQTPAEQV